MHENLLLMALGTYIQQMPFNQRADGLCLNEDEYQTLTRALPVSYNIKLNCPIHNISRKRQVMFMGVAIRPNKYARPLMDQINGVGVI